MYLEFNLLKYSILLTDVIALLLQMTVSLGMTTLLGIKQFKFTVKGTVMSLTDTRLGLGLS